MGIDELRDKRITAANDVPNIDGRVYVTHAVPRVANPDIVADAMNANATIGVITGADRDDNAAPNGFPVGEVYRKARFNTREGYLILDTSRRYNGGRHCLFTN